jgi:hypothetical protein
MFTKSYDATINYLAEQAPDLVEATKFIAWAESMVDVVAFIYGSDYEQTTTDLYEATKEYQEFND